MNRRWFVAGLVGLVASPSVVHAGSLMRIKPWSDVSAYGWIGGGIKKIGDYRVGDQFIYDDAVVVSTLDLDKAIKYIKRAEWEEKLKIKSTSDRYAPITIRGYDIVPDHGTLWSPVAPL